MIFFELLDHFDPKTSIFVKILKIIPFKFFSPDNRTHLSWNKNTCHGCLQQQEASCHTLRALFLVVPRRSCWSFLDAPRRSSTFLDLPDYGKRRRVLPCGGRGGPGECRQGTNEAIIGFAILFWLTAPT
jgi:hypothetical protein